MLISGMSSIESCLSRSLSLFPNVQNLFITKSHKTHHLFESYVRTTEIKQNRSAVRGHLRCRRAQRYSASQDREMRLAGKETDELHVTECEHHLVGGMVLACCRCVCAIAVTIIILKTMDGFWFLKKDKSENSMAVVAVAA